jgi:hypothetical protein
MEKNWVVWFQSWSSMYVIVMWCTLINIDDIYQNDIFRLIWSIIEILKNTQDVNRVSIKMPTFSDLIPLTECRFITKNYVTIKKL